MKILNENHFLQGGIRMAVTARSNCKICHGRGILGRNTTDGSFPACSCSKVTKHGVATKEEIAKGVWS